MSFWCQFTIPSSQDIVMIAHIANRFKKKNPQNAWIAQSEIVIFNFLHFVIICRNSARIYTLHTRSNKNKERRKCDDDFNLCCCWLLLKFVFTSSKTFSFFTFFLYILYYLTPFPHTIIELYSQNDITHKHTYFLNYKIKSHHKINISSY